MPRDRESSDRSRRAGRRATRAPGAQGELVPAEAEIARDAARQVLAGRSLRELAIELAAAGVRGTRGRPLDRRQLRRILTAPRTAALLEHYGEIIGPGEWEPLLDRATWEQVRAVLNNPARMIESRPVRYLLVGSWCAASRGAGAAGLPAHAGAAQLCVPTEPGALRATWEAGKLSLGQQRAVLAMMLERVVIAPATRGARTVDPARIVIPPDAWRA
ncbi:MAG TPA: recombinase family protein [Actinomycetes bacterium]|nr:recombinase family protein [Actinomycetes bacterium]